MSTQLSEATASQEFEGLDAESTSSEIAKGSKVASLPEEQVEGEEIEGLDEDSPLWGDYPIDSILVRNEARTIFDVIRKIDQTYVMDPDFQRDFIWEDDRQSKLIESVLMRIPLPVFYMAEDEKGQVIVVDGLQRLSTFNRFLKDELRLKLPQREDLHRKKFSQLPPKLQNRFEDCNLIFYILDSKVPVQALLDIFERVNSGVPLTRQQMRNSLFMGPATRFLKLEAHTEEFKLATGESLDSKKMRDREFVNRFCAFQLMRDEYQGDMDNFLAECLRRMNNMDQEEMDRLAEDFHRGLMNNYILFGRHAFRKHSKEQDRRGIINASLWDVMSTEFSRYDQDIVKNKADSILDAFYELLGNSEFDTAITSGTNNLRRVRSRFHLAKQSFEEILGAHST